MLRQQRNKPLTVRRLDEVKHFVNDDVLQQVPRLLHKLGIEADVAHAVVARTPFGLHSLKEVPIDLHGQPWLPFRDQIGDGGVERVEDRKRTAFNSGSRPMKTPYSSRKFPSAKLRAAIARIHASQGERVDALDPAFYPNPDRLDITRTNIRPLSFGGGIHYCLGAQLARIECEIAIGTLLRRLPNLRLDDTDHPDWRQTFVLRGLNKLPASW